MTAHAIRQSARGDLPDLIGAIDRSEHIDVEYLVVDGALVERPVSMAKAEIPPWDPDGAGPSSVTDKVRFCESVVDDHGGIILAARIAEEVAGVAVVAPTFEPRLGWLAFLHVTRAHRRERVASALWAVSVNIAREAGAEQLYVSAMPSGSAVGFYLSRSCRLADPVHPRLFEHEPDDIHLVLDL